MNTGQSIQGDGIQKRIEDSYAYCKRRDDQNFFQDEPNRDISQGKDQYREQEKRDEPGEFVFREGDNRQHKHKRDSDFCPRVEPVDKGILIGQQIKVPETEIFFIK